MAKKCQLCGGKLENNICTECGLDNSKSDKNYQFHKTSCADEPMTHTHRTAENPVAGKTISRQIKPAIQQMQQMQQAQQVRQVQKQNLRKSSLPVKIIVIMVIIFVVGAIISSIVEKISSDYWGDPYYGDWEYEEEYNVDPYASVQRELEQTGVSYDVTLGPGLYEGGVHLPEGIYTLSLQSGEGEFYLWDPENGIDITEYFGEATGENDYGYITETNNIWIYNGASLEISGKVELYFTTDNAGAELTQLANPIGETYTCSDFFVVGEDVPAGVYDVYCVSGSGIFEYYIPQEAGGYESYEGKLLDSEDRSFPKIMKNIVLPEGTSVTIDDMSVTLTPSEYIGSEDYAAFYQR